MRQAMHLLHLTMPELRTELQREMMANPLIEDITWPQERPMSEALPAPKQSGQISEAPLDFTPDGEAASNVLGAKDDDLNTFLENMQNFDSGIDGVARDVQAAERHQLAIDRMVRNKTLREYLQEQLALSDIGRDDRREFEVAEAIIGDIDDDGRFVGSVADIAMVHGLPVETVEMVRHEVMKFDPCGCGAVDLRETLLAQMEKLEDSPWEDEVRHLLEDGLDDLQAGRTTALCERLGVTPDELERVLAEVRTLSPSPGGAYSPGEDRSIYIRPEAVVERTSRGRFMVRTSERELPRIVITRKYDKMLEDPNVSEEDKRWVRERRAAAEGLSEALIDRQDTIRLVAQAIVDAQPEAIEKGMSFLRPLTQKQVADAVGVADTTVSRAVNGKYIRTPHGLVEMKKFFSTGIKTEGGDTMANTVVKDLVRKIIEEEDKTKPLSDDAISALLKDRHKLKVARRTVAKYRGQMKIPGTAERRRV